jgi:hypothetical protein
MRRKEGQSSTQYWKLAIVLASCYLFIISISSAFAPQDQFIDTEPAKIPTITSQYNSTGPLRFSSDEELKDWANMNGFEGDGSYASPLIITWLNVTSVSEPSLMLSNIRDTWFYFENCIFQSHLWYETLYISNISRGVFHLCTVYGALILNETEFSVIIGSSITEALYVVESLDTAILSSWFGANSQTHVMRSNNVSFYENTFFGQFDIFDSGFCYIVENYFFNSVQDDGFENYWNSNRYAEYDGTGPYVIPGSAESMDFDPGINETYPPTTLPPLTTISPVETTTPPGNGTFGFNPMDLVLVAVTAFEAGVVIMIVTMRRRRTQ